MKHFKDDLIKCSIIGDSNVGKTTIIDKFINNKSNNKHNCTIGAIYWTFSKDFKNRKIKLNLWDTAGQEKYHSLIPMYTRCCNIILLTFDLTNKKSLYNLEKWYNLTKTNLNISYLIIGNKKDEENLIQVDDIMISEFIKSKLKPNIPVIKTSGKTGENIELLFEQIYDESYNIIERRSKFNTSKIDYISLNTDINEKKTCCY